MHIHLTINHSFIYIVHILTIKTNVCLSLMCVACTIEYVREINTYIIKTNSQLQIHNNVTEADSVLKNLGDAQTQEIEN